MTTHRDDPLHGLDLIGLANLLIVRSKMFDNYFDNCYENQKSVFEVQNNFDNSFFEIPETYS